MNHWLRNFILLALMLAASGMAVMPTMDQPWAWCIRDSAALENRGPPTTTSVPPSVADRRPSSRTADNTAARPRSQ